MKGYEEKGIPPPTHFPSHLIMVRNGQGIYLIFCMLGWEGFSLEMRIYIYIHIQIYYIYIYIYTCVRGLQGYTIQYYVHTYVYSKTNYNKTLIFETK